MIFDFCSNFIKKIIDYSQQDNNIVEIYNVTQTGHITKFYPYTPLVMIGEISFYRDDVQKRMQNRYKKYFSDPQFAKDFYNRAVDSYIDFIEKTTCYFTDMSGNNIITNDDCSEFRIVDVFSINQLRPGLEVAFHPQEILVSHKYKKIGWDIVLNKFLTGCEAVIDNICAIETRKYKL